MDTLFNSEYCYLSLSHNKGGLRLKEIALSCMALGCIVAATLASSAINPITYYFRNGEYRQALCSTFNSFLCLPESRSKRDRTE